MAAPDQINVDPEQMYNIRISKVVTYQNTVFRPRDKIVVKGKVIADFGDAVVDVEEV